MQQIVRNGAGFECVKKGRVPWTLQKTYEKTGKRRT